MKRSTEITSETDRLLVLDIHGVHSRSGRRERQPKPFVWCFSCADYVRPLTTDEAAIQAHVTSLTIFHRVESGLLHFIETADRMLHICPNSV